MADAYPSIPGYITPELHTSVSKTEQQSISVHGSLGVCPIEAACGSRHHVVLRLAAGGADYGGDRGSAGKTSQNGRDTADKRAW